ncbi:MAG: DUF1501 domain-containing protein [Verrucomicrobia bacterium]|nr:DUF1501 domain-containing protein [Verrucomicrobiota bacterium]
MSPNISRRRFLGQANCAAISSLPLLSTLLNLKVAGTVAAATNPTGDYRSLVCLFLSGGIDTFNVLVPRGPTEYAEYAGIRGGIALLNNVLLPINPLGNPGLQLGLHPALTGIQSLFENGNAAYVANVGTLIEPVTKIEYNNGAKRLPLGLYSHSDQQEQWQTSMPNLHTARGWGGRTADMLKSLNSLNTVSMNISLTGTNIWQAGETVFQYTAGDGGATLKGYDKYNKNKRSTVPIRTAAVDSQLAFEYQHLLTETFQSQKRDAMGASELFNTATNVALPDGVAFPNTSLGNQFANIARIILGRGTLGHNRQTFFVEYGGWDHHDDLLASQAAMLPEVDAAVKAFYDCLTAMGQQNNVTLFTSSDFARTLTTDSDGADHAWGGNHLVMGGAVKGKQIYGKYPSLALNNPLDVGRGRLIPQVSVDSYFAELALWLGVPKSSLPLVLPNISTFYNTSSSSPPLGFMA